MTAETSITFHVTDTRGEPCPNGCGPLDASVLITGIPDREPFTVYGCARCGLADVVRTDDAPLYSAHDEPVRPRFRRVTPPARPL
jgi:hypothetical protein